MRNREDSFDIAKGIAMICIIMGHLGIGRINSFVYTFHVPLFFLISGYFLNDKLTVSEYGRKKFKQLMLPYLITSICITISAAIRSYWQYKSIGMVIETARSWLIAALYGSGGAIEKQPDFVTQYIGAIWFLPALFVALVFVRYIMQFQYAYIWVLLVSYVGYKTANIFWFPMSIQAGMFATVFVYVGMLARRKDILKKTAPPEILTLFTGIWMLCILAGGHFYLVQNYAENGILDIIGAIAGSYLVLLFSKHLSRYTVYSARFLSFFGRHTLTILCIHDFELKMISWKWLENIEYQLGFSDFLVNTSLVLIKILFCICGLVVVEGFKWFYNKYVLTKFERRICLEKQEVLPEKGRIRYWDITKGIAIIACVLGHCEIPAFLRMIIFSFHMPLFFIANGYFIKTYDIKRTFRRSVKTLLEPYIITCLISAVIYTYTANNGQTIAELFVSKIIVMLGGMSKISTKFHSLGSVWLVWFVCCLFVARNLYVILMKITEKYSVQIQMSVVLCMAIAGYMIGKYYAFLPWSFDVAMVSLVFLAFADWMRRSDFMNKNYFYTLVLPLAVWIYFLQMGIHIELATRSYPYGILSIIEAIAGSLVIISCSKLLERCKVISIFFAWCGKNSMIILILHCLEMMYFDWENLVYNRLPFTVYGFRIFIIKITVILLLTLLYDLIKKGCNFARINCVSK